jgi:glutamyl-tRNA reductase
VLVVGAGEMGEGMTAALADAGVAEVRVANRTQSKAMGLAERVGGRAVSLLDLPLHLAEVDLVLTSTGARTPMITADDLYLVMAARSTRPLLIVDIAMPRDVEQSAGALPGVTLLDMDDLRAFAEQGIAERRREVARVEAILDDELQNYLMETSAREVAPLVVALRGRAEAIRTSELGRFRSRFTTLDRAELEAVEAFTKSLVAKLLHQPTVVLKDAAGSPRGDRLVAALRELFSIETKTDTES